MKNVTEGADQAVALFVRRPGMRSVTCFGHLKTNQLKSIKSVKSQRPVRKQLFHKGFLSTYSSFPMKLTGELTEQ